MIKARIKKSDNSSMEIDIPENASEVKYSQALDFQFAYYSLLDFLKENVNHLEEKKLQYIKKIIDCLNAFYDGIADFYEINSSYINEIDIDKLSQNFAALNKKYNEHEMLDTVTSIFNLILKVIENYEPRENYTDHIIYNDQKYIIPTVWKNAISESLEYNSITVRQAISVLEAQAICRDELMYLEKQKEENKIDSESEDKQKADSLFTKAIFEISVLLMKEGETYPVSDTEFNKHIAEKMQLFENIDLQTVVDIQNWIEGYDNYLRNKKENYYYYNMEELEDTPDNIHEFSNMVKAKAKNKEIQKNIGHKSILSRILELRIFSGHKKTEIESALEAPYSDAVTHISINNAK